MSVSKCAKESWGHYKCKTKAVTGEYRGLHHSWRGVGCALSRKSRYANVRLLADFEVGRSAQADTCDRDEKDALRHPPDAHRDFVSPRESYLGASEMKRPGRRRPAASDRGRHGCSALRQPADERVTASAS